MAYVKKNPNLLFQGEAKMYTDCDTRDEFVDMCQFTGEWDTKRHLIMKKSRQYKVCLYLFDIDGNAFHSSNPLEGKADNELLWQVMKMLIKEVTDEYPDLTLAKDVCYVVVTVPRPSEQQPKTKKKRKKR